MANDGFPTRASFGDGVAMSEAELYYALRDGRIKMPPAGSREYEVVAAMMERRRAVPFSRFGSFGPELNELWPPYIPLSTKSSTSEERLEFERNQAIADRDAAKAETAALKTFVDQLSASAFAVGIVSSIEDERAMIRIGGLTVEASMPKDGCKIGDYVRVVQPSNQIFSVIKDAPRVGSVGSVETVEDGKCEVSVNGQTRSVVLAEAAGKVKAGDSVVIDETGTFALARAADSSNRLAFSAATGVSWEDVGGLDDAKEAIREAIEYPIKFADVYRRYGRQPSKGVLLYGPPGCGKTMIGKATATAIQAAHGSDKPGGFLYVKGPELLNKYVGATEDAIRGLFARARAYKAEHEVAAVLFIDEADALLGRRGGRLFSGMEATVVPTFLAEMDGLEDSGAFVMLSTNRPDDLDAAVTRDGRIDRKILVGRPTEATAVEIFRLHLSGRPPAPGVSSEDLIAAGIGELYGELEVREIGLVEDRPVKLMLRDCASGALIAGIVNKAVDRAIRREREPDADCDPGITADDVRSAVRASAREMKDVDLRQESYDALAAKIGQAAAAKHSEHVNHRGLN